MLRCIKALSLKVAPWRRSIRIFTIRRLAGIARIAGAKATSRSVCAIACIAGFLMFGMGLFMAVKAAKSSIFSGGAPSELIIIGMAVLIAAASLFGMLPLAAGLIFISEKVLSFLPKAMGSAVVNFEAAEGRERATAEAEILEKSASVGHRKPKKTRRL